MEQKHYTIQEYNRKTQRYITIGDAWGVDAEAAKLQFMEQHNWNTAKGFQIIRSFTNEQGYTMNELTEVQWEE